MTPWPYLICCNFYFLVLAVLLRLNFDSIPVFPPRVLARPSSRSCSPLLIFRTLKLGVSTHFVILEQLVLLKLSNLVASY